MTIRLARLFAPFFLLLGGALLGVSLLVTPANAASLSALRVTTSGNGSLSMAPGEVKEVTVTFQNTGSSAWKNDGAGYISLYTHGPKYRKSSFDPGTWLSASQVKRIREATVAAGGTASIVFQLHAPATEGTYSETFALASEGTAWITGGEFTLSINVAKTTITTTPVETLDSLAATLAMQSANKVKVIAGKSVWLTAGFTNTGTTAWTSYGMVTPDVAVATTSASFAHPSWTGTKLAYHTATVKPGETAYVNFALMAPSVNGTHTARFQFSANDSAVDEAFVELPVEVTGGAAATLVAPENENAVVVENDIIAGNLIDEPTIRVGVLIIDEETDNEIVVTSFESDFTVTDLGGNLLAEMTKGQKVTTYYDGTRYIFDRGNGAERSSSALRFIPTTANAVMTVTNFDRTVTRGSANADNTFRHVLEIRYNDVKDRTWLINELPMEYYLRGLAETSNISHIEFQKALITAARTYAFYHWTRATKHDAEGFHVDAYADQVYKGYGQEVRTPRVTEAIQATRGEIVTYDGATAITAYFSRSDGRTRDWSDVWGGSVPWSKAVSVPCDVGKTLWGHGVGMSASGALCMANDGVLWVDILKHFYTGIELDKRWE